MKLICPVCGKPLIRKDNTAVCPQGHSFDYAKQGYLNLYLSQKTDHGDNPEMIHARTAFLQTGAYSFLRDKLKEIMLDHNTSVLADLGCGEGYYTSALPGEEKYGFDLSRDALKHASRNDSTTMYSVASIFHVPLSDSSADTVLTCFAPVSMDEISRLLCNNGIFIFVTPGPIHLFEMKAMLYEKPYENPVEPLETELTLEEDFFAERCFHADSESLKSLFEMTPYAYHTNQTGQNKLKETGGMDLTAQFRIRIFRKTSF
jgi:23S rRNA (guanine745-N1)-methyltransferase